VKSVESTIQTSGQQSLTTTKKAALKNNFVLDHETSPSAHNPLATMQSQESSLKIAGHGIEAKRLEDQPDVPFYVHN